MSLLFLDNKKNLSEKYLNILNNEFNSELREDLEEKWLIFKKHSDTNFLDEIRKDDRSFNSRVWEMNLGYSLLQLGENIKTSNNEGPDFVLEDKKINIECVYFNKNKYLEEKYNEMFEEGIFLPDDESLSRITSSIKEKLEKYNDWVSKTIVNIKDPFFIAINCGSLFGLLGESEIDLIYKILFGIDYKEYFDFKSKISTRTVTKGCKIKKKNGSYIECNYFKENPQLSGVIFSFLIFNKNSYKDFVLIHNPFANNKIKQGELLFGKECVTTDNEIKIIENY